MRVVLLPLILLSSLFSLNAKADDFGAPSWRRYEQSAPLHGVVAHSMRTPGKLAAPSQPRLARLLQRARQLVGTPYRAGGESAQTGFDCSGLLVYLFRQEAGLTLPRTTHSMVREGQFKVPRNALKPGDAVFFSANGSDRTSHVGLYLGDDRFIHAPSSGKRVRIDSLADDYWQRNFTTARRFER